MADEPTLGEVARRLEAIHADLKEDFRDLATRLDKKVSVERYEIERRTADDVHRQLIERIAAIEQDRRKAEDQRRADRRLVLTALVAPVLILVLQLYLTARGAGS